MDKEIFYCNDCSIHSKNQQEIITHCKSNDHTWGKRNKVSIVFQFVLLLIPLGWIYASYRIKKFRKTLLLALANNSYIFIIILIGYFANNNRTPYIIEEWIYSISFIILFIIPMIATLYFMYKWSKQWNDKVTEVEKLYD